MGERTSVRGPGQKACSEGVEEWRIRSSDKLYVVGIGEQQGQTLVGASAFHVEDSGQGFNGKGVASQAVKGIGGVANYPVFAEKLRRFFNASLYIKRKHTFVGCRGSGVKLD